MNIDQPSLTALNPEPSRAMPLRIGEGHTLTLPLELSPVHGAFDAMSGNVALNAASGGQGHALVAGVVPANRTNLTLTF